MKIPLVDLKAQYLSIKNEIDHAITAVINDSAYIGGKYLAEFERAFADYLGVKHCVGVANGTDAIYVALKMMGVGQGDEVITAGNIFIATSEMITLTGATPVFVDNLPDTYNINPALIEAAITSKTKAIIPVHLYGQPADMDVISAIAEKHHLIVLEDAAQAHGATYKGRKAGTMSRVATFSFYPGKNLGAYGDAGAFVTNDDELAEKMRSYANHGRKDKYLHDIEGISSRLDGLQAAILNVKLAHLDEWVKLRRAVAKRYDEGLKDIVIIPKVMDGVEHAYHLYVVRVKNREAIQKALADAGIATGIHYPVPLPFQPAYAYMHKKPEDYPVSHAQMGELLSLPMYERLTAEQVDYVVEEVKKAIIN